MEYVALPLKLVERVINTGNQVLSDHSLAIDQLEFEDEADESRIINATHESALKELQVEISK